MKSALLSGAFVALLALPAHADVSPGFSWTGVYAGAHIGAGDHEHKYYRELYEDGDLSNLTEYVGAGDFTFGGAHLGYNYQFGNNIVIGGELDLSRMASDVTGGEYDGPGLDYTLGLGDVFEARVKLGYAANRVMVYGFGGYASGDLVETKDYYGEGYKDIYSESVDGFVAGLGLAYAVTDHVIIGVEYSHYEFDFSESNSDAGGISTETIKADDSVDAVTARISWKF